MNQAIYERYFGGRDPMANPENFSYEFLVEKAEFFLKLAKTCAEDDRALILGLAKANIDRAIAGA